MKSKILFIINPISGIKKKKSIPDQIKKYLDQQKFQFDIIFTEYGGHAIEIVRNRLDDYDIFVAVGGDGTINEVIQGLDGTQKHLGIIPMGSGNGLARHLGVPLKPQNAIAALNFSTKKAIDIGSINGSKFICTAGIGFDAQIGLAFSKNKTRGFWSYIKTTFKELKSYQPIQFNLISSNLNLNQDAFSITFANTCQFGNNAKICPQASTQDGLLDIVIIKKFPKHQFWLLGYRLFFGDITKSKYVEHYTCQTLTINPRTPNYPMHLDGEPFMETGEKKVVLIPKQLFIFTPEKKHI